MGFGSSLKKAVGNSVAGGMVAGPAGAAVGAVMGDKGVNMLKDWGKKIGGAVGAGPTHKASQYDYDENVFKDNTRSDEMQKALSDYYNQAKTMQRRQFYDANAGADMADYQRQLAAQLMAQTRGEGPSLAQDQLNRATEQNIAQAMALAASQRGSTAGQGLRQIASQTRAAQSQASRDSAAMRMQEQLAAQQGLAGVANQARSLDISNAQNLASANLEKMRLAEAMRQYSMSNQIGINQYDQNNLMELQRLKGQMVLGVQGLNQQAKASQQAAQANIISGIAGGAGAALSDEDQKKDKSPADMEGKVASFLDAIKAYEYKYKDPEMEGGGEGEFVSPMAQDLEKTELGKGMVEETPEGKMVNYGKASGLMLAVAAMLNDKVDSLEEKLTTQLKKKGK